MDLNNDELDTSKSNGLITKIWGPHFWETLHCVSAGYPLEPTDKNKKDYKEFYISVKNVLPCRFCRESYEEFITKEEGLILNDAIFESRENLMKWVYRLHERVNLKIGLTYGVTYEEVVDRLESFRAKCIKGKQTCAMPLNLKADSFGKAERKNAPIMDEQFFHSFKTYAKIRGIEFNDTILKLKKIKHNQQIWLDRDKYCIGLIKKMRLKAIPSVEKNGEYKNLPTIEELKLMKMLSTNICCEELGEIEKILKSKDFSQH